MPPTKNKKLIAWVDEIAALTQPDAVEWCDGSAEEYDRLCQLLVDNGTFTKLSDAKRPNSYWAHSDPGDVARVEDRTFICSTLESDAGPTNNWRDPDEMRATLTDLFKGSMQGRTMYVVPFSMGPLGSTIAHIGVEITDSAYVAVSMRIMTRMGRGALEVLGSRRRVRALPPLGGCTAGRRRRPTCLAVRRGEQVHRPLPRDPGDLVLRLRLRRQRPAGQEVLRPPHRLGHGPGRQLAGRAHAHPEADLPGRGDPVRDRRLPLGLRQDQSGHAHPHPPRLEGRDGGRRHLLDEVRPRRPPLRHQSRGRLLRGGAGHQRHTNPNAMLTLDGNAIFTNTALTDDGDVWWEGMTDEPPAHLTSWKGEDWTPESGTPAAHPNARFTVPAAQDPAIASEWEDPAGVPIDAILFGGRRASVVPLVFQSRDWEHGVFLGSIMASETTAAAAGAVGNLRRDPFAMLPFCGYNMADYFAHWLEHRGRRRPGQAPQDLLRQLVPQGRGRPLAVAGLRRELPGAGVGVRAGQRDR